MTADASTVEWFALDEGWDSSPITPAVAADVFSDLGATGLASWKPIEGTAVAVAVLDGRVVGTGSTAEEFAVTVARRTGAQVEWGPIAAGPDSGYIEAAPGRERGGPAAETRSIYVLPESLEELDVDRWLPRSSVFARTPSRAAHVVVEGRSVLCSDERGSWKWAKRVRPVVEVTAYAHGYVLGVAVPSGYVEARQDPFVAGLPDLGLYWWRVVRFGDAVTAVEELMVLRDELGGMLPDLVDPIDGVLAELGRSSDDAAALRALAEETCSDETLSELISILGLPTAVTDLLRDGAPQDAEAIPLKRAWFQSLRPHRRTRDLVG